MKTFINLYTLLLLLVTFSLSANDVELRFTEERIEGDLLYINVEARASTYDFNLAGHNIRAYYNHSTMELVEINSLLPTDLYGIPTYDEVITNGKKLELGILPFEDNMGFINMYVSLDNNQTGGIEISTDWISIHSMTFRIINDNKKAHIVWANDQKTQDYASAYVEIAEWLAPNHTEAMMVFDLVNFEKKISREDLATEYDVTIGPNPTSSYAYITQPSERALLSIIDMGGNIVKETLLTTGENKIDIEEMASGSYVFMIESEEFTQTEQIVITR